MARDTTKLQYWTEHIKKWKASGLAQRPYCVREDLKWPTFDYWRRQILSGKGVAKPAKKRATNTRLTLVPVRVTERKISESLVLRSPGGWELHLPVAVEAQWILSVLRQLP